jgi:hypothetical protein
MSSLLSELKKKREGQLKDLVTKIDKDASYGVEDTRFWKLETDKAGNGMAVIRFLFAPQGEDIPWVKYYEHSFQGPGGWYIDKCATSIGKECAICSSNGDLWNSGIESNKDVARKRKRRLKYISNILVVKDPNHPENDGKVFLFRYGKKIHDKIIECIKPKFADETPNDPFDFWTGCNFRLKQSMVEQYPNYDRSAFDAPSALSDDESVIERIWSEEYPLQTFLTEIEEGYNYDKQKNRLNKVLNETKSSVTTAPSQPSASTVLLSQASVDDTDLDVDYFRRLAEED